MTEDRDEILDDLRRALAIEPSPEFTARVRVAVAATAPQRARWMWIAAAGFGSVVIVAGVSI